MKVVFFGDSQHAFSYPHYRALAAAPCEIVAVVDTPRPPAPRPQTLRPQTPGPQTPPVKRGSTNTAAVAGDFVVEARASGVPVFEPASPNTPEFVAALRGLTPDLFICVGYASRLKSNILAVPRLLAANFHASLLPAYRGLHPLYWALQHGEREVGLTVHVMGEGLDTGDILYQVRATVLPGDTVAALYGRLMEQSVPLVGRLVADAAGDTLVRTPQPSTGASYYGEIP